MDHCQSTFAIWRQVQNINNHEHETLMVDGNTLTIPQLVAVVRHNLSIELSPSARDEVAACAEFFQSRLEKGESIYGVNTGFGGSADTRTDKVDELQNTLVHHLNCGVVTYDHRTNEPNPTTVLPEAWAKAAILVRANTLSRGHSGVRPLIIANLANLLNLQITPVIPLRGTVSASGDLMPLSYIAGALQGKEGIKVWTAGPGNCVSNDNQNSNSENMFNCSSVSGIHNSESVVDGTHEVHATSLDDNNVSDSHINGASAVNGFHKKVSPQKTKGPLRCLSASEAIHEFGLKPLQLAPKEGLALVNGTAVSAATGALAVHDANHAALLAQVVTAMSVEALNGRIESFDEFLNATRPHAGQVEVARNVRHFLQGSMLIQQDSSNGEDKGGLRQDRYSLRTTPQWIGPQLENLLLAQEQIEVEINSTTDNPIIDYKRGRILHGGNFQAMTITSAMEKVRQSLQILGRMMFVQCAEIINPATNNGLPPNLDGGEPSRGYLMKGVDTSMAAQQSELGYLANPVSSHVQNAEMGNQALNSLALISARYTHTALDIVLQMVSAQILILCQALDLRCLQLEYFELYRSHLVEVTDEILGPHLDHSSRESVHKKIWSKFEAEFLRTSTFDSHNRFSVIIKSIHSEILCAPKLQNTGSLFESLTRWTLIATQTATADFRICHKNLVNNPQTTSYLGDASKKVWQFVRQDLKIPFHEGSNHPDSLHCSYPGETIGGMITRIYSSLQDGRLIDILMDCIADVSIPKAAYANGASVA